MTHHFLRAPAYQPTPSELAFQKRHKEARERIDAAGQALAAKEMAAKQRAAEAHRRREAERIAELRRLRDEARKEYERNSPSNGRVLFHLADSAGLMPFRDRIDTIQRFTCEAFGIGRVEIKAARRSRQVVIPRQVAMFLCREMTEQSLPAIGRRFGGRDHTTVIHACQSVADILARPMGSGFRSFRREDCDKIRSVVASMRRKIKEIFGNGEDQP